MSQLKFSAGAIVLAAFMVAGSSQAAIIDVLVGDKDGFGFGCSNTGTCSNLNSPSIDNRSAGEASAVNGAQFTDIYSALFPGNGPNSVSTGDILLPFSGTLFTGAILSVAVGDLQSDVFGAFTANINGTAVSFNFPDGRFVTAIHTFTLDSTETAAANAAHQVDLHLDRNGSGDFVAFDWFELTGEGSAATPEPATMALMG